jgi:bifunctional UDP-N-acetylglucosamine pyrophosphorylase/glucosamine-1-phosphate N-acetyltransferase
MITTAVILAAGQGTRMVSHLPKVLHPLLGKPLIYYSVEVAQQVTGEKPVVVVGYGAEAVQNALGDRAHYVVQQPQLGTGHAMQQVEPILRGQSDLILVITADMPLLSVETLGNLVAASQSHSDPITMLSVFDEDARGFGRVVRGAQGEIRAIVEEAQATPEQLAIRELNPSIYCFRQEWLWEALAKIPVSRKGEYYLTEVVGIAVSDGIAIHSIRVADPVETIGINTRIHLAEAEAILRRRVNEAWMLAGVTVIDPLTTTIEPDVTIGKDTVIWPNCHLRGNTVVGENCEIGPNTIIQDSQVGNCCKIFTSVLDRAIMEDDVDVGPFANLRKGAYLCQGVHMGNFGEVKNSRLGPGTKMGHFSYIGDATIGSRTNIGAGTITCNYDGEKKNPTEIGSEVFVGSDTMLVAPVKVGEGAHTGAGAVVTKDIPPYTLAVGVPARVIRKLEKRD